MRDIEWELVPGFYVHVFYEYEPAEPAESATLEYPGHPGNPSWVEIIHVQFVEDTGARISIINCLSDFCLQKLGSDLADYEDQNAD